MSDRPFPADCSEELARSVLDSLSAHIAILDAEGLILETNRAWRRFAEANGMPEGYTGVGQDYLAVCEASLGEDEVYARDVATGIRRVIEGRMPEFSYDYPCHAPSGSRWYYMRAIRMAGGGPLRVVVSHENITALKLAEEKLRRGEAALKKQKEELEETNIALKVLLKQRENDRNDLEKRLLSNIKNLVLPYLEKLSRAPLHPREKALAEIIDTHIRDILSPLLHHFDNANILLTPQEMQVASLVKDGKSSKEIAAVLNVSGTTVSFHRKNLRRKLGLSNSRTNLRSYLLSIA